MNKIDSFRGDYRFLSNFWYEEVRFDKERYPTNEHAFQAAKTKNERHRREIAVQFSPGEAKVMGRTVTLRRDWEFIKLHVMLDLNRQKFSNPQLADQLLATGDAELIEGNTWDDKYWGVCNGKGENMLGKILMCVRDEIRNSK